MKIAFVTLPVSGHLNPMSALARRTQQMGQEVTMISVPDVAERAHAAELDFISVGADAFSLNSTRELERLFSTQTGEAALKFTFDLMGHVTGALLRPLTKALQSGKCRRPSPVLNRSLEASFPLNVLGEL